MNPFLITEPTVISFSGGRTSAYMLWRVLEAHGGKLPPEAVVCFANTGKEDEATLRFVDRCAKEWGVDIVWLEFRDSDTKFERVTFETASRDGEPFEALIRKRKFLPNPIARFCTGELKVLTIQRFMDSIGQSEFQTMIGLRADEKRRVAKLREGKLCPLVEDDIYQEDVQAFWKHHTFNLDLTFRDGKTALGNCDLCFLKGFEQVTSVVRQEPERAIWWAKMEEIVGGTFRKDRPKYADLASFVDRQGDMFGHDESIECFCGD